MTAWVRSVEFLTLTDDTSGATKSASLTKSQQIEHCFPLVTQRSTTGNNSEQINTRRWHDVTFSSGPTITQSRGEASGFTGNQECAIFVVEVDPSKVRIQAVPFSLTAGTGGATFSIPNAVVTGRTFLVGTWKSTDATLNFACALPRFGLSNSTTIAVTRGATTGVCSGTIYVVEALSDSVFTVEASPISSSAASSTDTIATVDTSRTFLIGSHQTTEPLDDVDEAGVIWDLTNSTTVTALKSTATATMQADIFVVQCAADSINSIQRGLFTWDATSVTATLSPTVTLAQAVAIFNCAQGLQRLNSASGAAGGRVQSILDISATNTVRAQLTTNPAGVQTGYWQVIDFALATGSAGTGTAAGSGVAIGVGRGIAAGAGAASGIGIAAATTSATATGIGAAVGTGVATAEGRLIVTSTGMATGAGAAIAISSGTGLSAGDGTAAGTGTASGVGASTNSAAGDATGHGTATAAGNILIPGVGAAAGAGTATGASEPSQAASGAGNALGIGAATGIGAASNAGSGVGIGVGTATASGGATKAGTGSSIGRGTATGVAVIIGIPPSISPIKEYMILAEPRSFIISGERIRRTITGQPNRWTIAA